MGTCVQFSGVNLRQVNLTKEQCNAPNHYLPDAQEYKFLETQAKGVLPPLSVSEGMSVAFAIAGVWTLGLIVRLYIRASQTASNNL
jgi:hypothetical protein